MADQRRREPDPSLQRAIEALRDVISLLPDAVAGAMGNALGRRQAEPAVAGGDAPSIAPDAGLGHAFRSLFPSMQRYFSRSDRADRPGGRTPDDAFSDLLRRRQRGAAPPDWATFLVGSDVRIGPTPRGHAGTQFWAGDVMADVRAARDARAAQAAMWGTFGHQGGGGSYSNRRWAQLQAMMGGSATPGAPAPIIGQPVPGQVHGRGWRPGITPNHPPIPTSFRAPGDLGRFGGMGWRGWASLFDNPAITPRARRNWGAVARRHGRAAARGFKSGAGLGAHFHAGVNAFGRRATAHRAGVKPSQGWASFQRARRASSARFGRGMAAAVNPAASSFVRVAGAGQAAGAALAKLAGAAGVVGAILPSAAQFAYRAYRSAEGYAEGRFEINRRHANYSASTAQAYAHVEMGDVRRSIQLAHANADTAVSLARNVDQMRNSFQSANILGDAIGNRLGVAGARGVAWANAYYEPLVKDMTNWLGRNDPGGATTEMAIDKVSKNLIWFQGYMGAVAIGRWGDATKIADEVLKEAERNFKAAQIPAVDVWRASLNDFGNVNGKPFIAPNRVRPVGP